MHATSPRDSAAPSLASPPLASPRAVRFARLARDPFRALALAWTALAFSLIAACGGPASSGDAPGTVSAENPYGLVEPGVLKMGTEPSYPPFEMKATTGEVIGFDVEIARLVAEKIGARLEIVQGEFDGLIPSLRTRRVDLVLSGMTITPERAQAVAFSDPYYRVGQVAMIRKSLEGEVTSAALLDDPKYKIGVQTTTTGQIAVEKSMPRAEIKLYQSAQECGQALLAGYVDAVVFDDPFVRIFASEHPAEVVALLDPFTTEDLGVAVHLENAALLQAVNGCLRDLEGSKLREELVATWFEKLAWRDR